MTEILWKVVKSDLTSAVMVKRGEVQYSLTDWTEAPEWLRERGYHLLVFNKLDEAIEFAAQDRSVKIFMCECEDEVIPIPPMCWSDDIDFSGGVLMLTLFKVDWPPETRMFKRVRLFKIVEKRSEKETQDELQVNG